MSKWINKKLFEEYADQKEKEKETERPGLERLAYIWKTPEKGTVEKPKVYEGRFLPDPKGKFTKKYFYHLFQSGETWRFVLCAKTWAFENWCPLCSATSKLYQGTATDKSAAYNYKRKQRHVSNFHLVDDPRDVEEQDESRQVKGKVRLYEFPDKIESKMKQEIVDKKNGLGSAIFDPGEEGFNFIVKVRSTKPNREGKIFPDYSDSTFARRSGALGTEREIRDIMEQTMDLEEYLKGLVVSDADMMELLKNEMLWEMVKDEWQRNKENQANVEEEDDIPDFSSPNNKLNDELDKLEMGSGEEDVDENELLKELDMV